MYYVPVPFGDTAIPQRNDVPLEAFPLLSATSLGLPWHENAQKAANQQSESMSESDATSAPL